MIRTGLALVLSVVALAACGDPIGIRAQFETVADTLTVAALTGTPVVSASGISIIRHEVVRLDGTRDFDLVADIDGAGRAVLYPVQLVGGSAGRAGWQKSAQPYDAILEAPIAGYQRDSAAVLTAGEVILVDAEPAFCAGSFRPSVYAKLIVDAIDAAARTVRVRLRVNPNCGFRSLAEGLPER